MKGAGRMVQPRIKGGHNKGKKMCPHCKKLFPPAVINEHILEEHHSEREPLQNVASIVDEVNKLQEENGKLTNGHGELHYKLGRAEERIRHYRRMLLDLCEDLKILIELDQEF